MWRGNSRKDKPENFKIGLGRWRLVVAIVFLLSFSLIGKLFAVQVKDAEIYKAKAANQHEVSSQLMPDRGKIYFTERVNGQEKLYPAASSKDMATIYAIPKDVENPREMAEKFYTFFDEPGLKAEAAKNSSSTEIIIATSTKEEIISGYLKRFDKPDDVYEPLNKKLDIEGLLKLYSLLSPSSSIPASDLELNNEKIYQKTAEGNKALKLGGIGFDMSKYRHYPEGEIGSHLLGYVSYTDEEGHGRYGLEEFFDEELFGKYGYLKSEKGGTSKAIIVNDREYTAPEAGTDIVLTIDRNIEFFACEKLKESVKKHGATGGSVIVIEPKTGAILAMCSEPDFNPNDYKNVEDISHFANPAILHQYEPGSVFKVITMAAAIDQAKVSPSTTFTDTGEIMINGWPKPIRNSDFSTKGAHGVVDMNFVLENSLNTGAIFAMKQTGVEKFAKYVKDFGFGERTGVELGSESLGHVENLFKNRVKEIDAATAAFGQGIAVTPLQMVMSYQAIANKGLLMKPYVVKKMIKNGKEEDISPKSLKKVISERTAETMLGMLVNIVEKGHSKKAYIEGYYTGGKTGTAQIATAGGYRAGEYVHTFIGIAPIEEPAFVMLTKIDSPKDVEYAEGSAVPLWHDIADFILKYYQIPKTRK